MLILNSTDVRKSLSMPQAIDGMRQAFAALGRGDVVMPKRTHLKVDKYRGEMLVMPSFVAGDNDALAVKVVGVFPENVNQGTPSVQGAVCVLDPETCKPLALIDGAAITGIRTAAVSAVASDYLAKSSSKVLAIIGTGVQARSHIEAICDVRSIDRIQVYGRSPDKVETLINDVRGTPKVPAEIVSVESGNAAVAGADIVCTTTSAVKPVFDDSALAAGTHINAVGSHSPGSREIPGETVARARIVVDQLDAAIRAGDLALPIQTGLIRVPDIFAELGKIASDKKPSLHNNGTEITFFKSVGLAMEDAVAARICVENAIRQNVGQKVDWQ